MARPRVVDGETASNMAIWRVAANILNKQSRTADKVWSSRLRVGQGANVSPWKPMLRNIHKVRCEMGGVCGTYGGGERGAQVSGGET